MHRKNFFFVMSTCYYSYQFYIIHIETILLYKYKVDINSINLTYLWNISLNRTLWLQYICRSL